MYGFLIFGLIIFSPLTVSAHPGRTDAYGCHTCRTNCAKWGLDSGEYHCHNAKALPQPLPPVTSHSNGVTEPAPQYAKPVVQPVVKTVPVIKPIVQPAPKPVIKKIEKEIVKPVIKPEPKKVTKPIEKVVVKPIVTSTPVVVQKPAAPVPTKESWWSKMKKWF